MSTRIVSYRSIIDDLRADTYSSAVIEAAIARLDNKPSAQRARHLLDEWLTTPVRATREGLDEATNFAIFLILANGHHAAHQACREALQRGRASAAEGMSLMLFAEQLGLDPEKIFPPTPGFPYGAVAADFIEDLKAGFDDLHGVIEGLLYIPMMVRAAIVRNVLAGGKTMPASGTFAALAMLYPFDPNTHRELLGRLMASGEAGRGFLERLTPDDYGDSTLRLLSSLPPAASALTPPVLKHVPLDWPVVATYASFPDGCGSQAIYIFRRRSSRGYCMAGAVVNDERGIVDSLAHPDLNTAEYKDMLKRLFESGQEFVEVPLDYAMARIREGIACSKAKHLPLPFSFRADRFLFAGLWQAPPVDITARVEPLASQSGLAATEELLAEPACRTHFFVNNGAASTRNFFKTMLSRVAQHQPVEPRLFDQLVKSVFDAAMRRRWSGRLMHSAYLFGINKQDRLAQLAAQAALALKPGSKIPLCEQTWVSAMLMRSALLAVDVSPSPPVESAPASASKELAKLSDTLLAFGQPILETMPPQISARELQRHLRSLSGIWNCLVAHEIAQEKGLPSELDFLINPSGSSQEAPVNAKLLKMLQERKQRLFPQDRRMFMEVTVTGSNKTGFQIQAQGTVSSSDPEQFPVRYFQLKIQLHPGKPPVWRRVIVPADIRLSDLHRTIQAAMGWKDQYLHVFLIKGDEYGDLSQDSYTKFDERKFQLNKLVNSGSVFGYTYSFGDEWVHRITVEKALNTVPDGPLPRCIGGRRPAPPEDIGGWEGYQTFVVALHDPNHREHARAVECLGRNYQPEAFSVADAQTRMAAFAQSARQPKGAPKLRR
jgi:hypothetical protein